LLKNVVNVSLKKIFSFTYLLLFDLTEFLTFYVISIFPFDIFLLVRLSL